MLGLVGNEWEPAESEYFSTGWNGGGALIICDNKPVWLCRLYPAAPVLAQYNQSKCIVRYPQCSRSHTRWRLYWLGTIDPSVLGDSHSAPGRTPCQHNNQQDYVLEWRQLVGGVRTNDGKGQYVGNLPKGYIQNVPLPRVPRDQSTFQSRVPTIRHTLPRYYEDTYAIPMYSD